MLEQKASRSTAIHTCPHCRRMLYAPELFREDSHANDGKSQPAAPESLASRS